MEDWEMYERELTPVPDKVNGAEADIRILDEAQWEKSEEKGTVSYKTKLSLSEEEAGATLVLRIHRAGCAAEVFEDGERIGSHYGSFTDWEVKLKNNQKTEREVEIRLREDRINLNPMEKAGILGCISLICLPEIYIQDYQISTDYEGSRNYEENRNDGENRNDEENRNDGKNRNDEGGWRLELSVCLKVSDRKTSSLKVRKDSGNVKLHAALESVTENEILAVVECVADLSSPQCRLLMNNLEAEPWSTENPTLYNLRISLFYEEILLEEMGSRIGFKTVRLQGQQILWNGSPLKLRGICYREPLEAIDKEKSELLDVIRQDLLLMKEAGVNYLRSLYYPFGKEVMELCDELGILTEQSASAYKVGRGIRPTQNLPDCRELYAGQFSELLKDSRNHVSTLLVCLGSESVWGNNFRICAKMARALAPKLLLNFSYPMTIPAEDIQPDVWSVLYTDWKQPLDVMYDHLEIGHANGSENEIGYVTGHSRRQIKPVLQEVYAPLPCYNRQQVIRDYGIHEFWGESIVRFQEKMEETKGALGGSVMAAYDEDGGFQQELEECNWGILDRNHQPKPEYYHLKMAFTGGKKYETTTEDTAEDMVENAAEGAAEDMVENMVEDTAEETSIKISAEDPYEITDTGSEIICRNSVFEVHVSRQTGLLSGVWRNGGRMIENGPHLHISKRMKGQWTPGTQRVERTGAGITAGIKIHLTGSYSQLCEISYCIVMLENGGMETGYTIEKLYGQLPPRVKAQIGLDPGGLDEFGIAYVLPDTVEKLSWDRNGIWEAYPAEHPGRNQGTAFPENTKDFESMKHLIRTAQIGEGGNQITVEGEGTYSIRMKAEPTPECVIDDRNSKVVYHGSWYTMDDAAGNLNGTETLSRTAGDYMEYTFEGSGVRVYGPVDHIGGMYRVTVDGETVCDRGSSFPKPVDREAASRGYEKLYRMCLAKAENLEYGTHTVRLEVLGELAQGGNDKWVSFDYLEIEKDRQFRMILNQDFNYTRLVRGNYMREPVKIEPGRVYKIRMKLTDREE